MINKDKNIRKSRLFTRFISLCLTLVMCFSVIIPTNVYAGSIKEGVGSTINAGAEAIAAFIKAGFSNMDGGGTVRIKRSNVGAKTNTGYNNILNEQQGYKISVWYAPMDEEATKKNPDKPVYKWGTNGTVNESRQIGKTIYWKRLYLKTNSGQSVTTDFYNTDSIYSQTTLGHTYMDGYNDSLTGNSDFIYLPTEYIYTPGATLTTDFYKNSLEIIKPFFNMLPLEKPIDQWTDGERGLYDWIARIYNMNDISKVDFSKINPETMEYSGQLGEVLRTKDDYQVPYAAATKSKIKGAIKDIEYIKSYFLNPNILNQIAYSSRPDWYDKYNCGVWQPNDFVLGTLTYIQKDGSIEFYDKGQYKIYIEPVMFRNLPKKIGVMSWRDMMLEHEAKGGTWDCGSVVANIAVALPEVSNSLKLSEVDDSLFDKRTGKLLEVSKDIPDENSVAPTAKNTANGLGVGVLSSPSLNSYHLETPKVVKTYVEIDSVDSDGNITYKKKKDTEIEDIEFFVKYDISGDMSLTNIPFYPDIIHDVGGSYLLNDVFTTDEYVWDIKEDAEWVNTDMPVGLLEKDTNNEIVLQPNVNDVDSYLFGIISRNETVINSFVDFYRTDTAGKSEYDKKLAFEELKNTLLLELYDLYITNGWDLSNFSMDVHEIMIKLSGELLDYGFVTNLRAGRRIKNRFALGVGQVNAEDGVVELVKKEEFETNSLQNIPSNALILRYIYTPVPTQFNVVEVRNTVTGGIVRRFTSSFPLEFSGNKVTIKGHGIEDMEKYGEPKLVEWVTNVEDPYKDISNGVLPNVSIDGKSGIDREILDYPTDPIPHNLYVKWEVEFTPPPEAEEITRHTGISGIDGVFSERVPEWRLSKYWKAYSEIPTLAASMSLSLDSSCCNHHSITPNYAYRYNVINPSNSDLRRFKSWIHSETIKSLEPTSSVTGSNPNALVNISGTVNAIKSTDTSKLKAASWIGNNSHSGLLNFDIQNSSKGEIFNKDSYTNIDALEFEIRNEDTYKDERWYRRRKHRHGRTYTYYNPTGSNVLYDQAILGASITFDRYNQVNTDSRLLTVQPDIKSNNGLTTLKYQDSDVLNVYPEYGMLFDNDNGDSSIKWMVGDQARKIQPVVYQTMEHKVYVKPTSTGNMATDNRARTSLNKVVQGDNTANGKQVLYKGGPVNTTFQMFRDSGATNKGILTVKTFALDIKTNSNDVNVKNEWGNGNYNAKQSHTSLLNAIDNVGKANVSEKLLVDSPIGNSYDRVVDYTGAIKSLTSDKYNRVKYKAGSVGGSLEDNGTVTVFEHELVVRGGQVIGVYLMNRSSGNKTITSISDLKNRDVALYNALLNMNLYNESNDKSQTVLSTFEHKTGNTLTEPKYAEDLQKARQSVDTRNGIKLSTPDNAKVFENEGWYSEDTTVLVVKEYVTNYEVPSISLSDKLSMSVKGLDTPIDKNQFFSVLGKGYTYLKYDLPLTVSNPKGGNFNTNSYFETSSLPNDGLDSFGYQGVDYLVPNVSISDTTRMN